MSYYQTKMTKISTYVQTFNYFKMEDAINERIKFLLKTRYYNNVSAFARALGVSQTSLNQLVRGDRKGSLMIVCAILAQFNDVSAEWLMRGQGEASNTNNIHIDNSPNSLAVGHDLSVGGEDVAELRADRDRLRAMVDKLLAL